MVAAHLAQQATARRQVAMGPRYTIITPSSGDRPLALALAIRSVAAAMRTARFSTADVEMLIGFDGVKGPRITPEADQPADSYDFIRWFDLPRDGDYGNGIRNTLLKAARGERILFVDDDNTLLPEAFLVYEQYPDADLVVARIDTSLAFTGPFIPEPEQDGKPLFRQSNVDPLCLCARRELVVVRCEGWVDHGYRADYTNMFRYYRRATSVAIAEQLVGVYDAGRHLDASARNFRHEKLDNPSRNG